MVGSRAIATRDHNEIAVGKVAITLRVTKPTLKMRAFSGRVIQGATSTLTFVARVFSGRVQHHDDWIKIAPIVSRLASEPYAVIAVNFLICNLPA